VDYREELVKYALVVRPNFESWGDRFSERKEREGRRRRKKRGKGLRRRGREWKKLRRKWPRLWLKHRIGVSYHRLGGV